MKVLYVTNMYPWKKNPYYGIFVKEQIEGLKKHYDFEYHVIFINGKKGKWNYLTSIFQINFHLLRNSYDLIHIHYGLSGLFALFNPFLKIPIVTTLHSGDIDPRKSKYVQIFISKLLIRKSKKVIILNEEMRRTVESISSAYTRIPCGVNTEIFTPGGIDPSGKPEDILVVFPGSRHRVAKNFPLFEKVVDVLSNEYNYKVRYEELERMTREQVARLFSKADCVIMTSFSEGSPQVIKEAMACNANIVSTPVGDVDVLLKEVENAHVTSGFDPKEIAAFVADLVSVKRNRNGREQVFKQKLDEEAISHRINDVYEEVLKSD